MIKQEFDACFVRKFNRHQNIGKMLYEHPKLNRIIQRMAATLLSINNDLIRRKKFDDFLEVRHSEDPQLHGYTEDFGDLWAAMNYAQEIRQPNFGKGSLGESHSLYEEQKSTLTEFFKTNKPTKFFNFGVCYAYIDSILSKKFPNIQFTGIDLSEHNKSFNKIEFGEIENLSILSGDVFKEFSQNNYDGAALFHSRTLVLLPRSFIQNLLSAAYNAGFRWIVGFEQHGLSEETRKPYTFDLSEKPSVYWRDRMYIHNYLGLAHSAGFNICSAEQFKTGHSSPDYRFLKYIAERR